MPQLNTLDIFDIIMWVSIGGALGGTAEYLRQIAYRDNEWRTNSDATSLGPGILLALFSAAIGVSGAIGFQFVLILLKSYRDTNTAENILFFLAVSVAAGFGARRLLPAMSESLEGKIKHVKEETDRVDEKATEATEEAREAERRATVAAQEAHKAMITTRAIGALISGAPDGDKKLSIVGLTPLVEKEQRNRHLVIILGRLHRALEDYPTAISVLDKFLNLKEREEEYDKDYADVLYNKACYQALLYNEAEEVAEKEEYKRTALETLARSIELSPENKGDAENDPDLTPLED